MELPLDADAAIWTGEAEFTKQELAQPVGEVTETTTPDVVVEFTVTLAEADFVVSAWLVASTVTMVETVTFGEVKSPVLEIVPADAVQVTAVFVEPETDAVNCWVCPEVIVAVVGEMETETGVGAMPTVQLTISCAVAPLLSVTCTVQPYGPAVVGVPEIKPVAALQFMPPIVQPFGVDQV